MSYDVALIDPVSKEVLQLNDPHQMRGGTYALGGTADASLNVTYNYAGYFHRVLGVKGLRKIYGMTGAESISVLEKAADQLGDKVSDNYWEATEGNVKRAIHQLIALAKLRPDGLWAGD